MVVKNATMKGVCRATSNWKVSTPVCRSASAAAAKRNPPTTGAGMLKRSSTPTRRRTP
jgi:hypothetical protein